MTDPTDTPTRIVEPPTEPGWYRARWNGETKSTCVEVVRRGSSLWVKMDELHSFADIAEWGESIDAVFAERDRLAMEVAEARAERDRLHAHADAMSLALSGICKVMLAREGGLRDEVTTIARNAMAKHGAIAMYLEEHDVPRPAAPGGPTT